MIQDYLIDEKLFEFQGKTIYKGRRKIDHLKVIIKTAEKGTATEIENEFNFLKNKKNLKFPEAVELINSGGNNTLVLKTIEGELLKSLIDHGNLEFAAKLKIAINLIKSISAIHTDSFINKNINSANILVRKEELNTQIIDYSLAAHFDEQDYPAKSIKIIEGDLNYISPEQTGRINKRVDYRSDFYSLGITLYELFTGKLPYISHDPLELVYSHIAKKPPSPIQMNSEIPEVISNIILKLIEKDPEDRYQSTMGLSFDLEECLKSLEINGEIKKFEIALNDIPDRFEIKQKLYGRDEEIKILLSAFEEISDGKSELLLVSGYSGVGKTSLINEIHKPITYKKGNFISGKFDQVNRQQPYSAFIQAFHELVRELLSESDQNLTSIKNELLYSLDNNAQVIIDVIPELELIIGKQPPVIQLGPTENQNRLNLYFQKFIKVFSKKETPLVLFLDDLQWADQASLNLIKTLITTSGISGFLLIGAYRDNEVNEYHPLILTLKELKSDGKEIKEIKLKPLELVHIDQLISESLRISLNPTLQLSELIHKKTDGNPFFLKMFLKSIYEENLLKFSYGGNGREKIGWYWDIEKISRLEETENVISLMVFRLNRISDNSRETIKTASCLGNKFALNILSIVCQNEPETLVNELKEITSKGFLIPIKEDKENSYQSLKYKFLHDRVQQAAYSLVPEDDKKNLHLKIGRLLLESFNNTGLDENIFEVVNHLNLGSKLIKEQAERLNLADLNLLAGLKAKNSAAFKTALNYFQNGIQYLTENCWSKNFNLCFELYKELSECEYLCGNFDGSEKASEVALSKAKSNIEKARIYILRIIQYENLAEYNRAVDVGRTALKLFNIEIPVGDNLKQDAFINEVSTINEKIKNKNIHDLINLPSMENQDIRICVKVLMTMWAPAYIAADKFLPGLLAAKIVSLSLQYGNTEESSYGYLVHGITIGSGFKNYETGFEFGKLALAVNNKFNDKKNRAKIHHMFSCFINLWREPIQSCYQYSREAFKVGLETGDLVYATYASFHESWYGFLNSTDLDKYIEHYSSNLDFLNQIKNYSFLDAQKIILNWGTALQGKTISYNSLTDNSFNEEKYIDTYKEVSFFGVFIYTVKSFLNYLFGNSRQALINAEKADKVIHALTGTIWEAILCLLYSLAISSSIALGEVEQDEKNYKKLFDLNSRLKHWSENSPKNFLPFYLLAEAEKEKVIDNKKEAEKLYLLAINSSEESNFIQFKAISHELLGKFYLSTGDIEKAKFHWAKSVFLFTKWGATEKVKQLETGFSSFTNEEFATTENKQNNIEKMTGQNLMRSSARKVKENEISKYSELDLNSIAKAAQAISKEIIPSEVSRKLIHIAMTNAGAQKGILLLTNENHFNIELVCILENDTINETGYSDDEAEFITSSSIINYISHTHEPLVIPDVENSEQFHSDVFLQRYKPKSVIGLPIIYKGELSGILYLENKSVTNAFKEERLEVLQILASQAAISLANAKLYEEKNKEITERMRTEQLFRSMTENTAALTGTDFFQSLVKNLTETLKIRFAFVAECADAGKTKIRTLAYADNRKIIENIDYDVEGTPCKILMSGKEYYTPTDLEKYFPREKGLNGFLGVPIFDHYGDVIGHIAVFDKVPYFKKDKDIDILRIFASRAGAEIERKQALEKLQLAHYELEQRIEERTAELLNINKKLETEIHEREKTELNLQKARDAAESANRAKSEFLANMSHELRTPLNAILGYTQIFKRDKSLNEQQNKAISIIHRSGEHLLTLINDILDLSKIEAQKLELHENDFDLNEFLKHITDMMKIRTEQKGLYFYYDVKGILPSTVRGDEKRLRQILINLLGNAVKFTDNGGINFSISSENNLGNIKKITFEIADSGIGLASEHLKEIFEPFQQFSEKQKNIEGAGLGLAISKKLIDLMKGEIFVESQLGKGSKFKVILPLTAIETKFDLQAETTGEIIGFKGGSKKILVVDDKWENRSVLVSLLASIGFEIYEAVNGEEAINKTFKIKPDMVLMDLVMPVIDGFEATRKILSTPGFEKSKIIALSASVFEYNKTKSKEIGCSEFIPKPVQADILFNALKKCMKLEWVYSSSIKEGKIPNINETSQKSKPRNLPEFLSLQKLYELAVIGDVQGIGMALNEIKNSDGNQTEFIDEIENHLKEYDMQKIKNLIKPLLE